LAATDDLPDPRTDYRRVEVLVPPDFTVECATRRRVTDCRINRRPRQLARLMLALGNTPMASLELATKKEDTIVRFRLSRPEARVQSKVLEGPSRWVLEIGEPLTLVGPIQDELPFRAYPVPTGTMRLTIPPTQVEPSRGDSDQAKQYNMCFDFWKARRFRQAVAACEKVDRDLPNRPTAQAATPLLGEVWYDWYKARGTSEWAAAVAALGDAEKRTRDHELKARYAILAAKILEGQGYTGRAERRMAERTVTYRGTAAEPYVVGAQARLLMLEDDDREARKVLEKLMQIPGNVPTVGDALVTLAGMAYEGRSYLLAVGLFDNVKGRWPEKIVADPAPLFQAAELFMLYGRTEEAKALYEEFLERYPQDLPNWVVHVRLAELLAHTDPKASLKAFERLASSLPETEGQDLAFLRYASLIDRAGDRRRIIGNLRRSALSDFVMQELLVRSARHDLHAGRFRQAYESARRLWTIFPDSDYLKRSPLLFDRVLLFYTLDLLRKGRPLRLLSVYEDQKARFEANALRGEAHLLVGRALRALAMGEEALKVLQDGLGGTTEQAEPDASARLYLEIAGVLRDLDDTFRLGEILEYLDKRHPRRFDGFEYWMAKGRHARNTGRLKEARDIYLFALNGPVKPAERALLAGEIADVYIELEDWGKAIRALSTRVDLHDRFGGERRDPTRRDARWRVAEIEIERGNDPGTIAAVSTFLEEYPNDGARTEALYFQGRALMRVGDARAAKRVWDAVGRAGLEDVYSEAASTELEMLRWREGHARRVSERAGFEKEIASTP